MGTPSMPPVPPRPDLGYGPGPADGDSGLAPRGPSGPASGGGSAVTGQVSRPMRRLGGYLLDALVLLPAWMLALSTQMAEMRTFVDSVDPTTGQPSDAAMLQLQHALVPAAVVVTIITFAYATALVAAWSGQTVGKRAARIAVVSAVDGSPVGWGRAAIRAAVPLAAVWIPWGIGGLAVLVVYGWMLFNPRRQGLHDLAAGTVVINR